jgi:hypothetical protein
MKVDCKYLLEKANREWNKKIREFIKLKAKKIKENNEAQEEECQEQESDLSDTHG